MGCYQTKSVKTENDNNGKIKASLPEPEAPPETDPRIPLNSREVFKLQKSWKTIHRNMLPTGIEMFLRMFRKDAHLKALFHGFRDVNDDSDLRENEALEAHAGLVMGIVDETILNIDNVDHIFSLLKRTGLSHRRFGVFDGSFFQKLEEPFLEAVKGTLEERFNPAIEAIYVTTIQFIIGCLIKAFSDDNALT